MVRLRKFFELNVRPFREVLFDILIYRCPSLISLVIRRSYKQEVIRVFFRFLFTISLLVLGADGLTPHHHINESMFWTDLLAILADLGRMFSSARTLLVSFALTGFLRFM